MCWTLEGADEIIQAEKESGKTVFVGYMRRYAEAFLRMKEKVQQIPTEKISYGEFHRLRGYYNRFHSSLT